MRVHYFISGKITDNPAVYENLHKNCIFFLYISNIFCTFAADYNY